MMGGMKHCIVCGHSVVDDGCCQVLEGLEDYSKHRFFYTHIKCGKPLCDFCDHVHGGKDRTIRHEFKGIEPDTSEWRQLRRHNINVALGKPEA